MNREVLLQLILIALDSDPAARVKFLDADLQNKSLLDLWAIYRRII